MHGLESIAHVDKARLKKEIIKRASEELMNLATPCYSPVVKKDQTVFLNICGLDETNIKQFINTFYAGLDNSQYLILKDVGTNIVLFIISYMLNHGDTSGAQSAMTYFTIKHYGSAKATFWKQYCNAEVFEYTLNTLTKTHLFYKKGSIPNTLFYLGEELMHKHIKVLKEFNSPEAIRLFVYECKSRIGQSVRSFASAYYANMEAGVGGFKKPVEYEETSEYQTSLEQNRSKRMVEEVVQHMTVYKQIDKKALEMAKTITKVDNIFSHDLIKELSQIKYTNNVKLILELYVKQITTYNQICGNGFFDNVKALMSIKKTNKPIYFKQQIISLTASMLISLNLLDKFNSLTQQTKFNIYLFIAYYVSGYFRNVICGSK